MALRRVESIRKHVANQDPAMELATERLAGMVSTARSFASRDPSSQEFAEALGEICRFLRTSKVLLRECMESYPSYFDHFEGFIEQALDGCALGETHRVSRSLRDSLSRHSQDMESLRARYKEEQAIDTADDSIGEILSGAVVPHKSVTRKAALTST